jgi:hypothetical protein
MDVMLRIKSIHQYLEFKILSSKKNKRSSKVIKKIENGKIAKLKKY